MQFMSLLRACQARVGMVGLTCEDEPGGSGFALRIQARLPETGQLLRWLLGAGDNLEVLEPEELRHTVAEQARKMAAVYPPAPEPFPEPAQAPVVTISTGAAEAD